MQHDARLKPAADAIPARAPAWINLAGIRLAAVNLASAVSRIKAAVAAGETGFVCLRDAHGVVRCQTDPELRAIHNRAFLVTPDGMPLVWALRLAGHRTADRVYGPDLMLALFDAGRDQGLRHFLYGTTPAILAKLEARLTAAYPGAAVVGALSPPFRDLTQAEEADVCARIDAASPDIVWVGLGTPKQELWMGRMRPRLAAAMLIGVGAAFDFHAGEKRQAPRVVQRSGFEWVYRLLSEPRRLGRRYAVAVPSFAWLMLAQWSGLRRFDLD